MKDMRPSVFMRNAVNQKMRVGGASLSPRGVIENSKSTL